MAGDRRLLTSAELDSMTPDERARAVDERIITDLDDLPADLRSRIETTGAYLAERHRSNRPR